MMPRYLVFTCGLIFCTLSGLDGQRITKFSSSKKEVLVGEPFTVEIAVSYPEGSQSITVNFEYAKETKNELYSKDSTLFEPFADIELLQNSNWKDFSCQHDFRLNLDPDPMVTSISNTCTFAIYNPGIFTIKPPAINGKMNDSLTVVIEVVVPDMDTLSHLSDNDIYPIKPIEIEPNHWSDYAFWLYGLIGLTLLYLGWKKYKAHQKKPSETKDVHDLPSPADIAFEKLKQLEESLSTNTLDMMAFHEKISYIIREYLENQMAIPALEMASTESVSQFQSNPAHQGPLGEKLGRILNYSDLVKFAKSKSEMEIALFLLEEAKYFVTETEQR